MRDVLLAEAGATLLAGLAGGVAQTTPYIGHPAFKQMGARSGYTLLTGLFIGLGGLFGYVANLIEFIPLAVLTPVLVFLALNIVVQAFQAAPARHAAAVALSFFPSAARLVSIELTDPRFVAPDKVVALMARGGQGLSNLGVILAVGNGFIITATLWAAFVAELIDQRLRVAACYLVGAGILALFGIIHSVHADGSAYLPWTLDTAERAAALQYGAAYLLLAAVLAGLSVRKPASLTVS